MSSYSVSPRTSYILRHRLHLGHQQELGQCPNQTHPWLVLPSPSLFSSISSSDESTLASSVGIIDASITAGEKPSMSDSLLISLKSTSRTAAAARDSSSSGQPLPAPPAAAAAAPEQQVQLRRSDPPPSSRSSPPPFHHVRPPRHQCLRSLPSCFVFSSIRYFSTEI